MCIEISLGSNLSMNDRSWIRIQYLVPLCNNLILKHHLILSWKLNIFKQKLSSTLFYYFSCESMLIKNVKRSPRSSFCINSYRIIFEFLFEKIGYWYLIIYCHNNVIVAGAIFSNFCWLFFVNFSLKFTADPDFFCYKISIF